MNGIDLSRLHTGDVVNVSDRNARLLIAEGWAEPEGHGKFAPVLIVEDDDDTRRMLADCVRQEGYTVIEARDGREGLAALVGYRPALVLLDLGLPRMSGREFCRAQRGLTDDILASVPVLVVSGRDDADEQGAALGASAVLHKPIDASALLTAIENQIAH